MKTRIEYRSTTTLLLLMLPILAMAEGAVKTNPYMDWMYNNIFLVLGLMVSLGALVTLWNAMNSLVEYQKREFLKEHGIEIAPEKVEEKTPWLKELYDKAWSLIPIDKEADIDLGHDYDGIRELDNRLPPWWVWTFYISIIVAIGYLYVYHGSDIGQSQHEEYIAEMERGERQKEDFAARQKNAIDENNLVLTTDANDLEAAKGIYIANCAACHGAEGQGGVGPNLTDEYWLRGGSLKNIYTTIKYGAPEKGMIAWKSQLTPATILKMASYVNTLKGTKPANAKAPQGDVYVEEVLSATAPE